jgi:hypothetical protein
MHGTWGFLMHMYMKLQAGTGWLLAEWTCQALCGVHELGEVHQPNQVKVEVIWVRQRRGTDPGFDL